MTLRFARVLIDGAPRYVRLEGDEAVALSAAPWEAPRDEGAARPLAGLSLLAPVQPSKVVAIGQNYRKHSLEMGKPEPKEPLLFLKPSTAINGPLAPILLPPESQEVHHESELALVIGQRLCRATQAEAAAAIFALTCFNDVTARDIQKRELQHTRAKGFDTFACVGPWLVAGLSPADLRIQCRVNGQTRQDGRSSDMVFAPAVLLAFMSHAMTLLPGDLIITGTPAGVGPLVDGDRVEVEIEGIGTLINPVQRLGRDGVTSAGPLP